MRYLQHWCGRNPRRENEFWIFGNAAKSLEGLSAYAECFSDRYLNHKSFATLSWT